jgi:hypothetical protein
MPEYKRGIENIPLQKINTSMPIMVIVYDLLNDDNVVIEKQVDFANYENRKWLGRLSFWCYTNHHSMETIALADALADTIKE